MTDPVLFARQGRLGLITLNRPEALNALNSVMIDRIMTQLADWATDDNIQVIVLQKSTGRAFCAGGDVREIYHTGHSHPDDPDAPLLSIEYTLDYALATYPKIVIPLIDGITFGGGAGISLHAPHAVATENTLFTMPEVRIGLLPDVGVDRLLAALPGRIGLFVGMTGFRLAAADLLRLGLVRYCVASAALDDLIATLAAQESLDSDLINELLATAPPAILEPPRLEDPHQQWIARTFGLPDPESIHAACRRTAEHDDEPLKTLAQNALDSMDAGSPLSLHLCHRLLSAPPLPIDEALQRNYILGQHCLIEGDMLEGVRALLIDKDNAPKWRYANLRDVPDTIFEDFCVPLSPPLGLRPYTSRH